MCVGGGRGNYGFLFIVKLSLTKYEIVRYVGYLMAIWWIIFTALFINNVGICRLPLLLVCHKSNSCALLGPI